MPGLLRLGALAGLAVFVALTGRAATLVVSNVYDSGLGSFRQAIIDANAGSGLDTISFQIPGSGVHTIAPASALPAITDPVVIDGTTQPGFAGMPLIELNGLNAGNNAGLRLLAGNTTIRALVINRFAAQGLLLQGGASNLVEGNFIGTDAWGTNALGNFLQGVWINLSQSNVIGGTTISSRNLISGNGDAGVYLTGASGNAVQGNFIGTTVTGTARLGNTNNGVSLLNAAGNLVGGTNGGARNIIAGNGGSGVYLKGAGAVSNLVQGNFIGTSTNGGTALGNVGDGITVETGGNNVLGGSGVGAGNLISGNGAAGISLLSTAPGNAIQGNLIGTDATGRLSLSNAASGITIFNSTNNLVGGTLASGSNVISANTLDGIFITNGVGNTIAGNLIGVDVTGTNALKNLVNGIELSGANSNILGGASSWARNILSGNNFHGVLIHGGSTANIVLGNYIGTDVSGRSAIGNKSSGVQLESSCNTLGAPGAGNLISGNGQNGVFLLGSDAVSNVLQANSIGTEVSGTKALRNASAGVEISGAQTNIIGGMAPGAGNLISGNGDAGIYLTNAYGNLIQGNVIGADATGMLPVGNVQEGIFLGGGGSNVIGGTAPGARNLISANSTWGMFLVNSSWNVVQGNHIGCAGDGVSPLGNGYSATGFHAIEIQAGCHDNSFGSRVPGAGNRIAFAPVLSSVYYAGIRMRDGATNNLIAGNQIFSNGGLGIDLSTYLVNQNDPCDVDGGANMLQNYPVLTQAVSGWTTGIRGTLNSAANTAFLLQFFANPACDQFLNGEGQVYLGDKTVATGPDCNATFVATLPVQVPSGWVITATATDPANNTSEFSACMAVAPVPSLTIVPATNHQVSLVWSNTPTGFGLEQTGSLSPPVQWSAVTNLPVNAYGRLRVTLPITSSNLFFALRFE